MTKVYKKGMRIPTYKEDTEPIGIIPEFVDEDGKQYFDGTLNQIDILPERNNKSLFSMPTLEDFIGANLERYGIITPQQMKKKLRENQLKMLTMPRFDDGKYDQTFGEAYYDVKDTDLDLAGYEDVHVEHPYTPPTGLKTVVHGEDIPSGFYPDARQRFREIYSENFPNATDPSVIQYDADRAYERAVNKGAVTKTTETTLPEFTVRPQFDVRINKVLDESLDDEQLGRFMEMYNAAGRPAVGWLDDHPGGFMRDGKTLRAYTAHLPKGQIMFVNNMHNLIEELAHPTQDQYGNNNRFLEVHKPSKLTFGQKLRNLFAPIIPGLNKIQPYEKDWSYDPDYDPRGGQRYDYPDRYEGETHTDFSPLMEQYMRGGIFIDPHQEKLVFPSNYEEVLDSARSYNMQRQRRMNIPK